MGPHEVVNGANGSVTWCQGPPFCVNCVQGARACERIGPPVPVQMLWRPIRTTTGATWATYPVPLY